MWIAHKTEGTGDTQRKGVKTIKASSRRANADEEDKYAAKSRGGNPLAMLSVYFVGQEGGEKDKGVALLPVPISVQTSAKRRNRMLLDPGKLRHPTPPRSRICNMPSKLGGCCDSA